MAEGWRGMKAATGAKVGLPCESRAHVQQDDFIDGPVLFRLFRRRAGPHIAEMRSSRISAPQRLTITTHEIFAWHDQRRLSCNIEPFEQSGDVLRQRFLRGHRQRGKRFVRRP
jgi:hypothetical protein